MRRSTSRSISAVIVLLLVAGGCSLLPDAASREDADVAVFNRSADSLFTFAVDGDAAIAFDPNPNLTLASDDPRIIAPGTSRTLKKDDLHGEFGKGEALYFFWYLPADTTVEGDVTFSLIDLSEISYKDLEKRSYKVYYHP